MEKIGFFNLRSSSDGPGGKPGSSKPYAVAAGFRFSRNIEFLFPYINAESANCEFHQKLKILRLDLDGIGCVLYPDKCIFSPLEDHEHARVFAQKLLYYLNDILDRKEKIQPKAIPFEQVPVTQIIKLLPGTNCRECGFKTCLAFAAMLSKAKVKPGKCPHMGQPILRQETYPVLDEKGQMLSHVTFQVHDIPKTPPPNNSANNISQAPNPFASAKIRPAVKPSSRGTNNDFQSSSDSSLKSDTGLIPESLSKREKEVLGQMSQGLTNREIADNLCISPHTVKSHVINIFNKLGVNHRTQAVVWAVRQGII